MGAVACTPQNLLRGGGGQIHQNHKDPQVLLEGSTYQKTQNVPIAIATNPSMEPPHYQCLLARALDFRPSSSSVPFPLLLGLQAGPAQSSSKNSPYTLYLSVGTKAFFLFLVLWRSRQWPRIQYAQRGDRLTQQPSYLRNMPSTILCGFRLWFKYSLIEHFWKLREPSCSISGRSGFQPCRLTVPPWQASW